jgi:hypothetical protein
MSPGKKGKQFFSGERKMKKIIASAVGLMLVSGVAVTTASAVESQFGGYWRTRSYFADNFDQPDSNDNITDTRTRLYYTAKFNDDLKFVNKFEFNSSWGDDNGGDVGADGKGNFRIKNSYVDATFGKVNAKMGIQTVTIGRGFVLNDDSSSLIATADFGMVKLPVGYVAISAEDADFPGWDGSRAKNQQFTTNGVTRTGFGDGEGDIHLLTVMPQININDSVKVTPHATWATITSEDSDLYYLGVDADLKFDAVSAWATAVYNGGQLDNLDGTESDISAFLLAGGADANLGMVGVHGQGFYGSGDDNRNDDDIDSYVFVGGPGTGSGYYWAEILGLGTFDNPIQTVTNLGFNGAAGDGTNTFQADKVSNVWALNAGVTLKPMDKMKIDFDVWYAELAEAQLSSVSGRLEDELGLELDGKLTYNMMDNLKAEFVFAYLFAGDAVGPEDVMEGGVQFSLAF